MWIPSRSGSALTLGVTTDTRAVEGRMCAVDEVWTTPHRPTPVDAVVALPGSKSLTARALVLAALADGPSRLLRPPRGPSRRAPPLRARDTDLMAAGLRGLGADLVDDGHDLVVTPAPLRGPAEVD